MENKLVRIRDWLNMSDIEIFLGTKLFERSGDFRVHVVPGYLIRLGVLKSHRKNPRNTVSLPLIALR